MKIIQVLFFIMVYTSFFAGNAATSKSFFMPRTVTQDAVLHYAGSKHFIDSHKKDTHHAHASKKHMPRRASKNKKVALLASNAPGHYQWPSYSEIITDITGYLFPHKKIDLGHETMLMPDNRRLDQEDDDHLSRYNSFFSLNAATPMSHDTQRNLDYVDDDVKSSWFTFSANLFYEESTNKSDLARYFFPNNKTQLVIKGATAPGARDISATWLQIAGLNTVTVPGFMTPADSELYLNAFQSTVSISPEMRSFGAIIKLYKTFDCISDRLWMSAMLPFMEVSTDLKLNEFDIQNAVTSVGQIAQFEIMDSALVNPTGVTRLEHATSDTPLNALEGFDNPVWKYGKLKNGKQKLAGLADINVQLGGTPLLTEHALVNIYAMVTIPTGYKPKAEYLFEPILGNAKHFSIGCGVSGDFDIKDWHNKRDAFGISSVLEYNYSFKNTEKRSFDLISNGQWSRYLLVFQPYDLPNPVPEPGINFFTQDCNVTPQSEINWLFSFHGKHKSFFLETGYNLWWHDREKVTLKELWTEQIALAYIAFESNTDESLNPFAIQSFSQATISLDVNQAGQGDGADINLVQQNNLDLGSATHPSQLTHKFYVTTGVNGTWKHNIFSVGTGASYEFASKNTALDQWGVWGQFTITV